MSQDSPVPSGFHANAALNALLGTTLVTLVNAVMAVGVLFAVVDLLGLPDSTTVNLSPAPLGATLYLGFRMFRCAYANELRMAANRDAPATGGETP